MKEKKNDNEGEKKTTMKEKKNDDEGTTTTIGRSIRGKELG